MNALNFQSALDQVELIEHAKTKLTEFWDALQSEGLVDCWDVCTLSYLSDVLLGDGDPMSSEFGANDAEHKKSGILLHVAIGKLCKGVRGDGSFQNTTKVTKATLEQIPDTIDSIKLVCESLLP